MGFSLGDKEATPGHTLLSVGELTDRCAGTNHRRTLKGVTGLVTDPMHICYLCSDLWTGELAAETVFSQLLSA